MSQSIRRSGTRTTYQDGATSYSFDAGDTYARGEAPPKILWDAHRLDHARIEAFEAQLRKLCDAFGMTITHFSVVEERIAAAPGLPSITIGLQQRPRVPDEAHQDMAAHLEERRQREINEQMRVLQAVGVDVERVVLPEAPNQMGNAGEE